MSENVIFCYSGTGNCLDMAKTIARELGDTDIILMRKEPAVTDVRDAKRVGLPGASGADKWEVFTAGGRNATGIDAVAWAEEAARRGAGEILLTSMDRDGTKAGYDNELTALIAENVSVPVIASGVFSKSRIQSFLQQVLVDSSILSLQYPQVKFMIRLSFASGSRWFMFRMLLFGI